MRQEASGDRLNVLRALRERTADAHRRLHELEPFAQLEAGTIEAVAYRLLMGRMLVFYRVFDALALDGLRRFGRLAGAYAYQPRAGRLAAEIGAPARSTARPADDWGLEPAESAGSLGGMLYVVDGAMLGGALLARRAERLGSPDDGHWQWCRAHGGTQWQSTRALLTGLAAQGCPVDEIVGSASATFAAFGSCMAGGTLPAFAPADRT